MSATTATVTDVTENKWMEIFHSKPSMEKCYLLEKLPNGDFTRPCKENELLPATHIRDGFRVMRREATKIEFILSDSSTRNVDDNGGHNYIINEVPGRYVVEHGIKRVGEVNGLECKQSVLRYNDQYIHVSFRADLWDSCYAYFQRNGEWIESPGEKMTQVKRKNQQGKRFELVIQANFLVIAFNNGADVWDSNNSNNYIIGLPGKYLIENGVATYISPSDKDLSIDPKGTPRPKPTAPLARPKLEQKSHISAVESTQTVA